MNDITIFKPGDKVIQSFNTAFGARGVIVSGRVVDGATMVNVWNPRLRRTVGILVPFTDLRHA